MACRQPRHARYSQLHQTGKTSDHATSHRPQRLQPSANLRIAQHRQHPEECLQNSPSRSQNTCHGSIQGKPMAGTVSRWTPHRLFTTYLPHPQACRQPAQRRRFIEQGRPIHGEPHKLCSKASADLRAARSISSEATSTQPVPANQRRGIPQRPNPPPQQHPCHSHRLLTVTGKRISQISTRSDAPSPSRNQIIGQGRPQHRNPSNRSPSLRPYLSKTPEAAPITPVSPLSTRRIAQSSLGLSPTLLRSAPQASPNRQLPPNTAREVPQIRNIPALEMDILVRGVPCHEQMHPRNPCKVSRRQW